MKSKKYKYLTYEGQQDFVIVLRERKFPWWILLLLPLLLLLKCNRQIVVNCYESETYAKISNQEVNLEYESHFVFNNGSFFTSDTIKRKKFSDNSGFAVFDSLPCSVYSYIFYCLSECHIFAQGDECHNDASVQYKFHYTNNADLEFPRRREDLYVKLVDFYTGEPLPNGKLTFGQEGKTESAFADEMGVVTLKNMIYCSPIDKITASCPEYTDTTQTKIKDNKLTDKKDPLRMLLTPRNPIQSPPVKSCGVHFSGVVLSDGNDHHVPCKIFRDDQYGEYVGCGAYPYNTNAFPKAVYHTIDAIAVDKGTKLIIYRKPNFEGGEVLNVTGPILITNIGLKNWLTEYVMTKDFVPELQELFPQERRQWSHENMHPWAEGSCKIICNK